MTARAPAGRYLGWLALGFGVYWLARGLSGLLGPAGACPLGLVAVAASALGFVAALLAVRPAGAAERTERARVALGLLLFPQLAPAALGIALLLAGTGAAATRPWLAASLASFAVACIWLGLATVAGWL